MQKALMAGFLTIVLLMAMAPTGHADANRAGSYEVVEQYVVFSGTSCDGSAVTTSTDPRNLAGGGTAVNSNPIALYNTSGHSVSYKYTAANAGASFALTFQHRSKWGDWVAFSPAVAVTCAGASGSGTIAVNLPVAAEVRIVRSADATHATTISALTMNRW